MIKTTTIGEYLLPIRGLPALLDQTKKIYDLIGEGDGNSNDIMSVLQFKVKSESYYKNMEELRTFGLVEGESRNVRITTLGLRAISEDVVIKHSALVEAFDNFGLWKILRMRFGGVVNKEDLSEVLAEINNGEQLVDQRVERIMRAYVTDWTYLNAVGNASIRKESDETTRVSFERATQPPSEPVAQPKEPIGSISYPEYSQSPIQIKDELSYEIAQILLHEMGRRLGIEKKAVQSVLSA
jgi:hypothetical protein